MLKMVLIVGFVLAFLGYAKYLIRINASIWYIPSVIISGIACFMYMAGILNIMPLMVYIILGFGIFLLLRNKEKIELSVNNTVIFSIVILGLCMWLIYYLRGALYADGDSMTHWGRIIRSMVKDDRLPNFMNREIYCQAYPPASACWIYFITYIFGFSERIAMFAQDSWILLGAITLFGLNKLKGKKYILMNIIILFNVLLLFINSFDTLIVDILLASVTVTGLVVIADDELSDRYRIYILSVLFAILPMIKNSGFIFVVFLLLALVFVWERKQNIKSIIILLSPSVTFFVLWNAHIKMVFAAANETRHSIGVNYMFNLFKSRDAEQLKTISDAFVKKWFSNNISMEWEVWVALLVGLLVGGVLYKEKHKYLLKMLTYNILIYLLYKIGMYGMYIFNMAGEDALRVAAYERYQWTFSLIMSFFITYVVALLLTENKAIIMSVGLFLIMPLLFFKIMPLDTFVRPDYENGGGT